MDRLLANRAKPWLMSPLIRQDFLLFPKGPSPCTASLMTIPICSLIDGFPPPLWWVGNGGDKKINYLTTKWKVTAVFCRGNVSKAFEILLSLSDIHWLDSLELQQPSILFSPIEYKSIFSNHYLQHGVMVIRKHFNT